MLECCSIVKSILQRKVFMYVASNLYNVKNEISGNICIPIIWAQNRVSEQIWDVFGKPTDCPNTTLLLRDSSNVFLDSSRFMKQRVETYREDEDETEMEHLPIPMHYEGHYQPGLYDVSGPPLKYFMPWATLGFFVASILMPVLAFTSSHCEGKHEMLAKYPYWW